MNRRTWNKDGAGFHKICIVFLLILCFFCLAPVLLVFTSSVTAEKALALDGYRYFPAQFSFDSYQYLWARRATILRCYGVSAFTTVVGTVVGVLITAMLAYALTRPQIRHRRAITFFVFFTMLFNGGVVASYMVWTRLFGVKNTIWALLLPNLLTCAFNVLLVKNYYQNNIPKEILEAAQMDGANEGRIFFQIVLPLAKPVITTVALFTALVYWNDWVNGLYYVNDSELYSIQVYLNVLMNNIQYIKSGNVFGLTGAQMALPSISIRMAIAVIAMLPLLLVFPFVQKSLIKGVVIGGVKG